MVLVLKILGTIALELLLENWLNAELEWRQWQFRGAKEPHTWLQKACDGAWCPLMPAAWCGKATTCLCTGLPPSGVLQKCLTTLLWHHQDRTCAGPNWWLGLQPHTLSLTHYTVAHILYTIIHSCSYTTILWTSIVALTVATSQLELWWGRNWGEKKSMNTSCNKSTLGDPKQ